MTQFCSETPNFSIIPPITITDALFVSSNVAESILADWDSITSYTVGQQVRIITGGYHEEFECISNSTNDFPPDNPLKWASLGPTNRWAMFSPTTGTVTSNLNTIVVELAVGTVVNSIALFGLVGLSVQIEITDPTDGLVYDELIDLTYSPDIVDWYTYFYSEFAYSTETVKLDLPSYPDATIKITITAETGTNAECAHVCIGKKKELGYALYGTGIGIIDYSRKEVDAFGNPIIVQRKFAQTVDYDAEIPTNRVREVQRTLSLYRASPVAWIGSNEEDYAATIIWGWYKTFGIVYSGPDLSSCTIQVEEFK